MTGSQLADFYPSCPCGPTFEIDFNSPVSDAVFAFVTNPGTSTLTSYLDDFVAAKGPFPRYIRPMEMRDLRVVFRRAG